MAFVAGDVTASDTIVWRARLEPYLDSLSVYTQALTNSFYQGEVSANKSVEIISVNGVDETAYTGSWEDEDWGSPATDSTEFQITEKRKLLIRVADTDQLGNMINLIDATSQRSAVKVVTRKDRYIAGFYSTIVAGAAANQYGTEAAPIVIGFGPTQVRPLDALAMCWEVLTVANAFPTNGRIVIPPWMGTMLGQELSGRNTVLGDQAVQNGATPRQGLAYTNIGNFSQVWISANVPDTTAADVGGFKVIYGDPWITLASAIDKLEVIRLQNDFATGVKSLYVYGAAVPEPKLMGVGTFQKGLYKQQA